MAYSIDSLHFYDTFSVEQRIDFYDQLMLPLYIKNLDRAYIFCTYHFFEALNGIVDKRSQLIGKKDEDFINANESFTEALVRGRRQTEKMVMRTEEIYKGEIPSSGAFPLEYIVMPAYDEDQELIGTVSYLKWKTKLKTVELMHRNYNNETIGTMGQLMAPHGSSQS